MPPEIIVPTMIMDCDEGTAFKDGYKLSKWFMVVMLNRSDSAIIVIDKARPMYIAFWFSVSRSTSIRNLVATLLTPE